MKRLVLPNTDEGSMAFKEWLAEKHNHPASFFPSHAYGYGVIDVGEDGSWKYDNIVLSCVLQSFHFPGDILASYFASDPKVFFHKKLITSFLNVPYLPPFDAHRVTIIIKTVHHRSVEVALRYGFQGEGILKNHFGGEDGTILRRLRPKDLEA